VGVHVAAGSGRSSGINDLCTGRKVLPPEQPLIRGPFKAALWILPTVIFVSDALRQLP
jgi:hypothetical protein